VFRTCGPASMDVRGRWPIGYSASTSRAIVCPRRRNGSCDNLHARLPLTLPPATPTAAYRRSMVTPIFIASHSSPITGPIDYLERYLRGIGCNVVRIDHPLDTYTGRKSVLRRDDDHLAEWGRSGYGLLSLIWDFAATVCAALRFRSQVAIGANNIDTLGLLVARQLRLSPTPRIVYFAADFAEDRFSNRFLNRIYLAVESLALKGADAAISNTRRAEARRIELGLDPQRSLVIPNGVRLEEPDFMPKLIRKDKFIFVGSVTREHGLYELLAILKPQINSLTIMGDGEDWDRVVGLCDKLGIPTQVFRNRPHREVLEFLRTFDGFGLAPYNRDSKWTYYCSPLKVSEYVASGVPVITSAVPEIAGTIQNHRLGIVYDIGEAARIAVALDDFDPTDFHIRAKRFYEAFNSDRLFSQVPL